MKHTTPIDYKLDENNSLHQCTHWRWKGNFSEMKVLLKKSFSLFLLVATLNGVQRLPKCPFYQELIVFTSPSGGRLVINKTECHGR